MTSSLPFVSLLNFLYQRYDEHGKPTGPKRFKEIIEECWFITKNVNTSYNDVLQISPLERKYLIDVIRESQRIEKDEWDKSIKESQEKTKSRRR